MTKQKKRPAKLMKVAGGAGVDLLPPEIWIEILNRLPAKSVLRCRPVCKLWYSLVSCPDFISKYSTRNRSKNSNRVLLGLSHQPTYVSSYSSHDELFTESSEHNYITEKFLRGARTNVIGSCNGLICLFGYDRKKDVDVDVYVISFLIWNPTIRKIVELPSLTFQTRTWPRFYLGFGFDSNTNDYKVLCIVRNVHKHDLSEIFYLRNGVWRGTSPLMHSWGVGGERPECYLNEAVHWSGYGKDGSFDWILLSFSMRDECFREIELPDSVEFKRDDNGTRRMRSSTLGGLLSVVVLKKRRGIHSAGRYESCSVWIMKEYGVTKSWTKMSSIDLHSAQPLPNIRLSPDKFHVYENNEVLMVHDILVMVNGGLRCKHALVSYNTETRKCKHLFQAAETISDVCLYNESLVLM